MDGLKRAGTENIKSFYVYRDYIIIYEYMLWLLEYIDIINS